MDEFALSNINAEIFRKDAPSLFQEDRVEVIDINKLKDESKEKTVDVQAFEGNNLVLVDEGHRGTAGESSVWMKYRSQLCSEGFSFEYSATFGQAMEATNNPELPNQYAKCILFDYSYKHFYKDGYGKKYQILNLKDWVEENRQLYLTASLLATYQQLRIFNEHREEIIPYNVEKPLWVFVASRVTTTASTKDIPEVLEILEFLSSFIAVANRENFIHRIQKLVTGTSALIDRSGRSLFQDAFKYLDDLDTDPEVLYSDIFHVLFNAAGPGRLRVTWLRSTDGELSVQVGDSTPFGVINVGDPKSLKEKCGETYFLEASEQDFAESLFSHLNDSASKVNLLIGAKKFAEGWNSYRVSNLGLLNVGRTEGAQIIQLFGRGVRLRGKDFSLKRSTALPSTKHPAYLPTLERLYVFGLKADYMDRFRQFLDAEGVPAETIDIAIPIVKRAWPNKLRVLRPVGFDFKKTQRPTLDRWNANNKPVVVDWYPQVLSMRAKDDLTDDQLVNKQTAKLHPEHIAFLDFDEIYFDLQELKGDRGWSNFNLPKAKVRELFEDDSWYTLLIPTDYLAFTDFSRVRDWQTIATALLKKYCDRYYKIKRSEAEIPHLRYVELKDSDSNFIEGEQYSVTLDETQLPLQKQIEVLQTTVSALREAIAQGDFSGIELKSFGQEFKPLFFAPHLYSPLIASESITISPVALNKGERQFVEDLRDYYQVHKDDFFSGKELFLLRNRTRGRGIGFFEAGNFYPDFIVWLFESGIQRIAFVDPKGLIHQFGLDAPKLQLYKIIKERERELGDPMISLDAFILSDTPFRDIGWLAGLKQREVEERNVFFLEDGGPKYLEKLFRNLIRNSSPAI